MLLRGNSQIEIGLWLRRISFLIRARGSEASPGPGHGLLPLSPLLAASRVQGDATQIVWPHRDSMSIPGL